MVDNGAPYSAIGYSELSILIRSIHLSTASIKSMISPLPDSTSDFQFWQVGSGQHASSAKPIIGSVVIDYKSDSGYKISIRHIVVEGSSPWVLWRNITRKCDLVHMEGHYIRFPPINRISDSMTMIDHNIHSYVPLPSVYHLNSSSPSTINLIALNAQINGQADPDNKSKLTWPQLKRLVDLVHDHTCGHATFSDVRFFLTRTQFRTPAVSQYFTSVVNKCAICLVCSATMPSTRVSISNLNRSFNENICIYHFSRWSSTIPLHGQFFMLFNSTNYADNLNDRLNSCRSDVLAITVPESCQCSRRSSIR